MMGPRLVSATSTRGTETSGRLLQLAALGVTAGLCACGGGNSVGRKDDSLAVSPQRAAVAAGESVQFSVAGGEDVAWGIAESGPGPTPAAFPLDVSADHRYLVDQGGRPWRIQADAAWLMSTEATPDDVDLYLATRRAQGFNAFYLHAMVHPDGYEAAPDAPADVRGDPPFDVAGDFSTAGTSPASERYWSWIDSIIDKAAAHDMVVMLAYTYLGSGGGDQGWYQEVLDQPSERALFEWGLWLGNRFKDDHNIIWLGLGDYTPPRGSDGMARARVIAEGIKAAGATQLFMAEPSPPDGIPGEVRGFSSLVDLNSFYGYGPDGRGAVYVTSDRAWRRKPRKPAWMQEGTYEYEDNSGHFSGESWETRRGRFWSVLAGGTAGDGFGSRDAWQLTHFPESLSSPGADYSSAAFDLFDSLPWWELRPSGTDPGFAGRTLITAGQGTWGESDYITAALTDHGDWLLAYAPVTGDGARTFKVDLGAMAGPIRARWFDPATGNYLAISDGYELANEHARSFTTPAVRGDGTDDWVLVLDSTGSPRCGTITADGVYSAPTSIPDGIDCQVTATLKSDPSVVARAEPIREVRPVASQSANAHGAESSAAPQPGDEVWTRRDRWSR
jgi:Protein of unknown function (DUF4038)/Putative collagen-binding domain of a collagenase